MEAFLKIQFEELTGGLPDQTERSRDVIRLLAAMLLGAIIGYKREQSGKAPGLRTHMLVAMGSALPWAIVSCPVGTGE